MTAPENASGKKQTVGIDGFEQRLLPIPIRRLQGRAGAQKGLVGGRQRCGLAQGTAPTMHCSAPVRNGLQHIQQKPHGGFMSPTDCVRCSSFSICNHEAAARSAELFSRRGAWTIGTLTVGDFARSGRQGQPLEHLPLSWNRRIGRHGRSPPY